MAEVDNKTFTFDRETEELIIMENKERAIVLNKHETICLFNAMLDEVEYEDIAKQHLAGLITS